MKKFLLLFLLALPVFAADPGYPTHPQPIVTLDTTKIIALKVPNTETITVAPTYAIQYADVAETAVYPANAYGSFTTSYASAVSICPTGFYGRDIDTIIICNIDNVVHTFYVNVAPTGTPATITAALYAGISVPAGGTLTLTASGSVSGSPLPDPLTVPHGGTGLTSGTSGAVPYFNSTTTMASSSLLAANQLIVGGGAGAAPATLGTLGTTTTLLHGNAAGAPTYGAVTLTTDVTGVLSTLNGGTGAALTPAIGDIVYASSSTGFARLADVAAGSFLRSGGVTTAPLWSTTTWPNSATTGDIVMATSANTLGVLAGVAAGSYLRSGGVATASVYSTTTLPNTTATGDILTATSTNTVGVLAIGAAGKVVQSSGTATQYAFPLTYKTVTFTSNAYTVATTDAYSLIGVTTGSTTDQTVTLPAAATAGAGFVVGLQKVDSGTKVIIIACNAADTVNGASSANTIKLTAQYAYMELISTGAGNSWIVRNCSGDWIGNTFSNIAWTAGSTTVGGVAAASWASGVAGITLTPGEWDLSTNFFENGGTTVTQCFSFIGTGTATGTDTTGNVNGDNSAYFESSISGGAASGAVASYRVVITTATTYFLKGQMTYVGAPNVFGRISARRIR